MWNNRVCAIVILITIYLTSSGHAQTNKIELPDRISEVDEDDLILLNVAAKGRVVELLANELARTEIIRALLVEYARECAHNVSVLETHCIDCMMDRCSNRLLECGIELPPLSEVISHDSTPIKGLQFLSKPPQNVGSHLDRFIKVARPDILDGVPKKLQKTARRIVEEEVDQSLKDLVDNRDTDTALSKIKIHEKGSDSVKTKTGSNGMVFVIRHVDHGESMADILGRKLRKSRPLFERLSQRGAKAMDNMPAIVEQMNTQISDFRQVVGGLFGDMMNNFQQSMNQPNTAVVNSNGPTFAPNINQQQTFRPVNNFPQGSMSQNPRFQGQGQFNQGQFNGQQSGGQQQFQQNQMFNSGGMSSNQIPQMPNVQPQQFPQGTKSGGQGQFNPQQNAIIANPTLQDMVGVQPRPTPNQGQMFQRQGPMNQGQSFPTMQTGVPQDQWQSQGRNSQGQSQGQVQPQSQTFQGQPQQFHRHMQGQNFNSPSQGQTFQGQPQSQNFQGNSQAQGTQGQAQGQNQQQSRQRQQQGSIFQGQSQGRRKRDLVECSDLKSDPETHCRKFEAQCYNCTLEKRLRFEVCGEGVERARDEIKRLDTSVDKYLETFDNHIAGNRLILKIELNDRKRLHKSDSYNDAFITAKIGPSIIRFQSKMILNIKNIRVSGSQIGDELWEKLWGQEVFKEAERVEIPPKENDIMGQTHNLQKNSESSARHTSAGGSAYISAVTFTLSVVASVFVYFL